MTKYLPYGGFEWISANNFSLEDLTEEDEKRNILIQKGGFLSQLYLILY